MLVPLVLAGPGIPKGEIESACLVDLAPTILDLWGKPQALGNLDGTSILRQFARPAHKKPAGKGSIRADTE